MAGSFEEAATAYSRGDYATTLMLLRPLAAQGHVGAQFRLGFMYLEGRGVSESAAEAAKWFREAAEQGYSDAQFNLGTMYTHGQGVQLDVVARSIPELLHDRRQIRGVDDQLGFHGVFRGDNCGLSKVRAAHLDAMDVA
jgi:TPR repeat protein